MRTQPIQTSSAEPTKRSYNRKIKEPVKVLLNRYESALYGLAQEMQPIINEAGQGSLSLLVGAFISKYSLELFDQTGKLRKRLIRKTLLNLEKAGKLKISPMDKNYPIGLGIVSFV